MISQSNSCPVQSLSQRAELTFKDNIGQGRHGWLRLTPAYSVNVVRDILKERKKDLCVLDPFSGTGTTALCSAQSGYRSFAIEINPFLVWLSRAKIAIYEQTDLIEYADIAESVCRLARNIDGNCVSPPPISNIDRWWDKDPLNYLCRLLAAIFQMSPSLGPVRDLLLIAFCRTLIELSNASFNHQSVSFDKSNKKYMNIRQLTLEFEDVNNEELIFKNNISFILKGASENPLSQAAIVEGDARNMDILKGHGFDLLITSPPYPNRMSYIRELRPYMYWLGFLENARQAGELDWRAIGGTWGIATSRLIDWHVKDETYYPEYLPGILDKIGSVNAKSGRLLANYVGRYFEDIWQHLRSMADLMDCNGEVHYIIGNSRFYDVTVPCEQIYRDMMIKAGLSKCEIRPIRKRNSKKELYEFDVVGWK
jgi:hypothetical protein